MRYKKYCYQVKVSNSISSFIHRIIHIGEGRDDQLIMAQAISQSHLDFDFDQDPGEASLTAKVVKVVETDYADPVFRN